jgi:hypothetical protein
MLGIFLSRNIPNSRKVPMVGKRGVRIIKERMIAGRILQRGARDPASEVAALGCKQVLN